MITVLRSVPAFPSAKPKRVPVPPAKSLGSKPVVADKLVGPKGLPVHFLSKAMNDNHRLRMQDPQSESIFKWIIVAIVME